MRTQTDLAKKLVMCAGCLALVLGVGMSRADDQQTGKPGGKPENKEPDAKAAKAKPPETKKLCDGDWHGQFWTLAVDKKKYDGTPKILDAYDPQHPKHAWRALSERYLRHKDGGGNVYLHKFIGRFYDEKEAEDLLKTIYRDMDLSVHVNPRYPPYVSAPGAYLASDKYNCTLNKQNDTLSKADWIVEMDGYLFAGGNSACKGEEMKKTVAIVACDGTKKLVTDAWPAPCGASVESCIYPMAPGVVGIWQDFSSSEAGRQTSFRVYSLERGKRMAAFEGGGDWEIGGGSFRTFEDRDGDGIPEITDTKCIHDQCIDTRMRKWKKDRFVDIKVIPEAE